MMVTLLFLVTNTFLSGAIILFFLVQASIYEIFKNNHLPNIEKAKGYQLGKANAG